MVASRIYFFLLSFVAVFGLSRGSQRCSCNTDGFASTEHCYCNNYEKYCNTGNPSPKNSCLCLRSGNKGCDDGNGDYCMNNGQHMYYVCTRNCGGYAGQVDGQCSQCEGGNFFGSYSTSSSLEECQSDYYYQQGGSQGVQCVETNDQVYKMIYVYSHTASDNWQIQFYTDECSQCPGKAQRIHTRNCSIRVMFVCDSTTTTTMAHDRVCVIIRTVSVCVVVRSRNYGRAGATILHGVRPRIL